MYNLHKLHEQSLLLHSLAPNQFIALITGADLGGVCRGCTPPPPPEVTCSFLIQLVFSKKDYVVYWC